MTHSQRALLSGLATLVVALPASGHHSISRHYHRNQSITVTGLVRAVLLNNPHAMMQIEVDNSAGGRDVWTLEMDDPGDLAAQGIVEGTFQVGDEVVAVGNPGREDAQAMFVRTMTRPADGLEYEDD
jgi:hypothetical protein